jgi:hypothetical protein
MQFRRDHSGMISSDKRNRSFSRSRGGEQGCCPEVEMTRKLAHFVQLLQFSLPPPWKDEATGNTPVLNCGFGGGRLVRGNRVGSKFTLG